MQFRIRTLLLVTLAIAILIAFFAKPYFDATSEHRAISVLEREFSIMVGAETRLGTASWSPKPIVENNQWIQWPITQIVGQEKLNRCRLLRIIRPQVENASLRSLSSLDKVSHLTINPGQYVVSRLDCKAIGAMKQLVELNVSCRIEAGFEHLRQLPLKRLNCRGSGWEQAEFDAIGEIQSLESLFLSTSQFTEDNIAAFANLKNLNSLQLNTKGSISGLNALQALPKLKRLTLNGNLSSLECEALCSLPVEELNVYGSGSLDDLVIQRLNENKYIKAASFGHMQISVDSYDALLNAGIDVEHGGLTGAELTEEFCCYNQIYYPVDQQQSSISAELDLQSDSVNWSISVTAGKKPRHDWTAVLPPKFRLYSIPFDQGWRDLAGSKAELDSKLWHDTPGNFYDGIHKGVNDNKIEIVSRDGNLIHIRWDCRVGDSQDDSVPCQIDATIPFTGVRVKNYNRKLDLEAASAIVAKHFDLADFCEPQFYGNDKVLIQFDLNPARKDP